MQRMNCGTDESTWKKRSSFSKGLGIASIILMVVALGSAAMAYTWTPVLRSHVYADDDLSIIQAAVDAGGVVTFHATNHDGSPGTYVWDQPLQVNNSVTLTGPPPLGTRNVPRGRDDRRWGVHIVREGCPLNSAAIQVLSQNTEDTVVIENLSIETDCNGISQIGESPAAGTNLTTYVPTLGCNLEIRDSRIVVDGIDSTGTSGNRAIRVLFVGNASLIVEGSHVVAATTPEDGIPYTGDNDAIFTAYSAHFGIEITDNIVRCDSRSNTAVSAAFEAYYEQDPDSVILITNNYLESQANLNIRTEAPVTVIGNVLRSENNRMAMYIVNVNGATIGRNKLSGTGTYGALLVNARNTYYWNNDSSALQTTAVQMSLDVASSGNTVTLNRFGPIGPAAGTPVVNISGSDNRIRYNNYRETAVPGWPSGRGCVSLSSQSLDNEVFELSYYFPRSTTLCEQVRDLGDNTVVRWEWYCE